MSSTAVDSAGRRERLFVLAVALHSAAVGVGLLCAGPGLLARFGFASPGGTLFFVRQAGVFHLVVACGYLIEQVRHGEVAFLVATKSIAFVFLGAVWLAGGAPWIVPLSALGDGLLGLGAWWLHRAASEAA